MRQEVKVSLNVTNESLSDKYLCMPSEVGRSKNGTFKYIKDGIWKKVQAWLEKMLSC